MLSHDRSLRFAQMDQYAAQLRAQFTTLTSAHSYFHEHAVLKSVSISDALAMAVSMPPSSMCGSGSAC
jgi:hypothetical protein